MKALITLSILIFFIGLAPAHADQIYDIEILPAKEYAKPYHFSCSVKLSPCSIAINAGSTLEPKIIEIEAFVAQKSIQFRFAHNRKYLDTAPQNDSGFSLKLNDPEPQVVDLYKPAVEGSSVHAIVRPPPKFMTSLNISWSPKE